MDSTQRESRMFRITVKSEGDQFRGEFWAFDEVQKMPLSDTPKGAAMLAMSHAWDRMVVGHDGFEIEGTMRGQLRSLPCGIPKSSGEPCENSSIGFLTLKGAYGDRQIPVCWQHKSPDMLGRLGLGR